MATSIGEFVGAQLEAQANAQLEAQRIAQLEAQAKTLVKTNPQFNALIKDFISPTMTTSEELAKQLGLNSNYDDLLSLAYGAVDEAYGATKKGFRNTANSFQQSLGTSGYTLLDALRKAQASNLGDGAYSGLNTANALSALLGMSQQHSTNAYDLALQEANIDAKYSADRMAAQNTTLNNYNSLMAQLGSLSSDKYATDMQGYIAELTAALQQAALQQQAVESSQNFNTYGQGFPSWQGTGSGGSGSEDSDNAMSDAEARALAAYAKLIGLDSEDSDLDTDKTPSKGKDTTSSTSEDTTSTTSEDTTPGTGKGPAPGSGIFRKYIEEHGTELELSTGDGGLSNMQYVAEYMDYVDRYGRASPEMQLYLNRIYTPEEQKMLFDTFLPYATEAYKQTYDSDGQNTKRGEWGIEYNPLPDKYLPSLLQGVYAKDKNPLTKSGWAKVEKDLKQKGIDRRDTSTGQGAKHVSYTMYATTEGLPYWSNDSTGEITYKEPTRTTDANGVTWEPHVRVASTVEDLFPFLKDFQEDYKVVPPAQPDFTRLQNFTNTSSTTNKRPVVGRPAIDPRRALAKSYLDTQAPQGNRSPTFTPPVASQEPSQKLDIPRRQLAPLAIPTQSPTKRQLAPLDYPITPLAPPASPAQPSTKNSRFDNTFADAIAKIRNILPAKPTPPSPSPALPQAPNYTPAGQPSAQAKAKAQAEAQAREARARAAYARLTGKPATTQAQSQAEAKARAREQATAAAQAAVAPKGVERLAISKNMTPVRPMRNHTPTRLTY